MRLGADFYPTPIESCVVCDPEHRKRNALLFDRVHAWVHETDVPSELVFRVAEIDEPVCKEASDESGYVLYGMPVGFNYGSTRRRLVEAYQRRGFDATPTYASHKLFYWDFDKGLKIAYDAALNNIPSISDTDVSWEQILEFRSDPDAKRKYRDLRYWLHYVLKAESVAQATDLLAQKIDDYEWAIRKHGFKTVLGAISQVFDWKQSAMTVAAAGMAGVIGGLVWSTVVSGGLIAGKFAASLAERKLDLSDVERSTNREVAILYDIRTEFG